MSARKDVTDYDVEIQADSRGYGLNRWARVTVRVGFMSEAAALAFEAKVRELLADERN